MTDKSLQIEMKETPKICAIDLDEEIVNALKTRGLQCFSGTLGSQIKVSNSNEYEYKKVHHCRLRYLYPPNLHEYDIVLIDLKPRDPVEYYSLDHQRPSHKGSKQTVLISRYPETIFDPRPYSANILEEELRSLRNKESLIIVFSTTKEVVEYHSVLITSHDHRFGGSFEHKLYELLPNLKGIFNKYRSKYKC